TRLASPLTRFDCLRNAAPSGRRAVRTPRSGGAEGWTRLLRRSLKLQDFLEALEAHAKIRDIVRPKPPCMRIRTTSIHMVHPLYDRCLFCIQPLLKRGEVPIKDGG